MSQSITIESKDVYGRTLYYPICDKAKLFLCMTERKTLSTNDLAVITSLGYAINFKIRNTIKGSK